MSDNMWKHFKDDFDSMSDREIDDATEEAQSIVDEQEEWLDAVASWKAAGRPRTNQALADLAEVDAQKEEEHD